MNNISLRGGYYEKNINNNNIKINGIRKIEFIINDVNIAEFLDIDTIVLNGAVVQLGEPFLNAVSENLADYVAMDIKNSPARYGETAGVSRLELEAIEEEKERIRAERRAANPDGITENTSKKKLQKKLQSEQEAAKAAAKREYEAKKGIVVEEAPKKEAMSGIADRPYCKGRNYDPNRYGKTEE